VLVTPPLVNQARELWAQVPDFLGRIEEFMYERQLFRRSVTVEEVVERAPAEDIVVVLSDAIAGIVGGIVGFVSILILTFYLLLDSDAIFRAFVRVFPIERRPRVAALLRTIGSKVSAWLVGQLLIAAVVGVTASLGLALMGVPFFYVLGLLAAIGELIPIVGPLLAAIPALIVAFTVSPLLAVFVAVFYIVLQQVESHVLVPKLMERQVGIRAVTVLTAVLIGGSLLGLLGLLLAVPTAAIVQVLLQEVLPEH
jgi:predicted PurR-regulated permease PerM